MTTSSPPRIREAVHSDLDHIYALLTANHLPLDGLAEHINTTLVLETEDQIIGSAALELYADSALLRSVCVAPEYQGQGLGHQLIAASLQCAEHYDASTVYLLTETAAEFFPRFGFQVIARTEVPDAVRGSVEFVSACPDSAVAMARKRH
ncbi:MAG: arsenic resistance N-acetyltransferase ArsN2 [Anaerolineae bacterium]